MIHIDIPSKDCKQCGGKGYYIVTTSTPGTSSIQELKCHHADLETPKMSKQPTFEEAYDKSIRWFELDRPQYARREVMKAHEEECKRRVVEKFSEVTRVEVIDDNGRSYTNHNVKKVFYDLQDDNQTLKVFINWKMAKGESDE